MSLLRDNVHDPAAQHNPALGAETHENDKQAGPALETWFLDTRSSFDIEDDSDPARLARFGAVIGPTSAPSKKTFEVIARHLLA